jgi:glycosyltransferase involved in cell wall biosynthesis
VRICSPHCGLDPETTSGGETYERELLRHLAERGAIVDLILARHKRCPEGVRNWVVHRLPIGRGLRWPVAAMVFPPFIKRVFEATHFDLLRVHSLRFIGPAALMARRRYRLPVPVVSHHHHLDPSWFNPLIERRVIQASDRVITVSEFSRRQLVAELGVDGDRVDVVPNGVDERFGPAPRDLDRGRRLGIAAGPVVLWLGGLKPRKNLPFLLEVWRDVVAARPDATLLVAGSGPLEPSLRRRAVELGLARSVVFAGRIAETDKVGCYNLADVFVSTSALEGFGFTVAEAMSCALPVVVSNQGALPELVVAGEGGFVCDSGNLEEFGRSLLRLLADEELRRRLGAFNRARVDRHFRWPYAARRTLEIYEEVIGDWKRGVRRA